MKHLTLFLFMAFSLFLHAQVQNLEVIGQTPGGGGYHVNWDEANNKLIIGCGTSIWVYDMSDPHNPVKVQQRPLLGLVNETEVHGDILFVAATHDGIFALDYTSPNLDILDNYSMKDMDGVAAYGMHRSNDTIFVADFTGIRMLRYNTGTGFAHIGSFGANKAFDVHRKGDYIAVSCHQVPLVSNGKIQVFSLNNLTNPVAEWVSPWINWVQAIQWADLRDDIIYVCGGPETALFNKSNLFALQFDGTTLAPLDTFSVVNGVPGIAQLNIINMDSRNDTLFVATTAAWDIMHLPYTYIPVIDATGLPNNKMEEISRVTPGLWHFDVALMHGTPYAAMSSEWLGVLISDVSELAFMDTLGFIETGGWVKNCKVKDNMLWVSNEGYGLTVYDIDSLQFSNGFWCNSRTMHIHSTQGAEHFFLADLEFLNDTLLMLNTSKVFNIKPWQAGGSPVLAYNMNKTITSMKNIHTNTGQRMVATATDLVKTWLMVFDPFDAQNNYANFFLDSTNNEYSGYNVSGDTLYYGKKFPDNTWYLIAAKVANNQVTKIDSIQLSMPWGLISFYDVTGISVENGKIAVSYGKQLALFHWNNNKLEELFVDFQAQRVAVDAVLRNDYLYIADKFYGMRVFDVSSYTGATLVAQTRGTGGWMNVFGSQAITVGNDGRIYVSDFSAGVILIEAFDTTSTSVNISKNMQSQKNYFAVFPNPASDKVFIQTYAADNQSFTFHLFSIAGRKLSSHILTSSTTELQLNLPAGIYFYQIKTGEQIITSEKLIIY